MNDTTQPGPKDDSVNEKSKNDNSQSHSTRIDSSQKSSPERVHSGWKTFAIVLITMLVTLVAGYWVVTIFLFPTSFTPVVLSQKEKTQLDHKLEQLKISTPGKKQQEELTPEPYTEAGASRDVYLTEKELNSLLANNTDLASHMVIDLSDNLASVKLLINLDPDFPILAGKTIKITSGMELDINKHNPRVILKGVSVWGVPLPDAWLGNMKNIDLLKEFGLQGGFWQSLKEGIEEMKLEEGKLRIRLKQ